MIGCKAQCENGLCPLRLLPPGMSGHTPGQVADASDRESARPPLWALAPSSQLGEEVMAARAPLGHLGVLQGTRPVGSWLVGLCVLAVDPPGLFFDQPSEKPNCLKGIQFLFLSPLKFGAASPTLGNNTYCVPGLILGTGHNAILPKGLLEEFSEN